ncbi:MAG: metallophosphoesterase family protein [Candidatus Micrarchaeia archaeon]
MKIAILSDFHLGYERFYDDAYLQAQEAVAKASELADILVVPGDIFDNRSPKPEVLAQGINLFRSLHSKNWEAKVASFDGPRKIFTNLPIIAIPGTHERRSENAENAVGLLNLAGLLVDISEARAIIEKNGENVAIYGVGGISEERFRNFLKEKEIKPVENAFNIFVFHQSIYDLMPFDKNFIYLEELPKGFDLYIDGHIHSKYEGVVHSMPFLIPGSTVLTQLKENEVEKKGFYLFDTSSRKYEFIEINSREFFVVKVDVSGKSPSSAFSEAEKTVGEIVASHNMPVIRLVLTGEASSGFQQADFELFAISKKFEEKAIIEISKNIKDKATEAEIDSIRNRAIENLSIKDFGIGIFLQKLGENNYTLDINPSILFEILSSEKSKEKAVAKALSSIFKQ